MNIEWVYRLQNELQNGKKFKKLITWLFLWEKSIRLKYYGQTLENDPLPIDIPPWWRSLSANLDIGCCGRRVMCGRFRFWSAFRSNAMWREHRILENLHCPEDRKCQINFGFLCPELLNTSQCYSLKTWFWFGSSLNICLEIERKSKFLLKWNFMWQIIILQ